MLSRPGGSHQCAGGNRGRQLCLHLLVLLCLCQVLMDWVDTHYGLYIARRYGGHAAIVLISKE